MPAGLKVLAFMAVTLAITMSAGRAGALLIAGIVVVASYLMAGFGLRELGTAVFALRWLIVIMLVMQALFLAPLVVLENTGRVVAVVVFASLITLTTRIPALLDATERALAPLRRFGVSPSGVALVLALTITTIPVITAFAATIREAQRARGAAVRLRTFAVPLLVMSLKHSDELADALAARGVE